MAQYLLTVTFVRDLGDDFDYADQMTRTGEATNFNEGLKLQLARELQEASNHGLAGDFSVDHCWLPEEAVKQLQARTLPPLPAPKFHGGDLLWFRPRRPQNEGYAGRLQRVTVQEVLQEGGAPFYKITPYVDRNGEEGDECFEDELAADPNDLI